MQRWATALEVLETAGPAHVSPDCIAREIQYEKAAPLPSASGPSCGQSPPVTVTNVGEVGHWLSGGFSEFNRYTAARSPASAASSAALPRLSWLENMCVFAATVVATAASVSVRARMPIAIAMA